MKHRLLHIISIMAIALALTACSDSGNMSIPLPSTVEILPQASVCATRADLGGVVSGTTFPDATSRVFAVSAFLESSTGVYDLPYFLNQALDSDASGKFHFNPACGFRFFPEDHSKLYFYAFSPASAVQHPTEHKTVSWTLTGQEDIMFASDLRGLSKIDGDHMDRQPQPVFSFVHLLARLNFRCRREAGFADNVYITSISFKNRNTTATLNLDNGINLSFSNPVELLCYTLPVPHMVQLAEGYKEITSMMMEPAATYDIVIGLKSGLTVELTIEASKLTWDTDDHDHGSGEIDHSAFKAGYSYNVNMRFEGAELTLDNVTVSPWNDGGSTSGLIIPEY